MLIALAYFPVPDKFRVYEKLIELGFPDVDLSYFETSLIGKRMRNFVLLLPSRQLHSYS